MTFWEGFSLWKRLLKIYQIATFQNRKLEMPSKTKKQKEVFTNVEDFVHLWFLLEVCYII